MPPSLDQSWRLKLLLNLLRGLAVLVILKVLVLILANYPDYFPPNFNSLFLQGRERSFNGLYVGAFYIHIFSAPIVLLSGLILLSDSLRRRYPALHRSLGYIHIFLLLTLMLPSSMWMARFAFAGWLAGVSFMLLTITTAVCAILGLYHARHHHYASHRRWMGRCYVLICSAVVLRLISGTASLFGPSYPETSYIVAAWCSWLIPLAITIAFDSGLLNRPNSAAHSKPVR